MTYNWKHAIDLVKLLGVIEAIDNLHLHPGTIECFPANSALTAGANGMPMTARTSTRSVQAPK